MKVESWFHGGLNQLLAAAVWLLTQCPLVQTGWSQTPADLRRKVSRGGTRSPQINREVREARADTFYPRGFDFKFMDKSPRFPEKNIFWTEGRFTCLLPLEFQRWNILKDKPRQTVADCQKIWDQWSVPITNAVISWSTKPLMESVVSKHQASLR